MVGIVDRGRSPDNLRIESIDAPATAVDSPVEVTPIEDRMAGGAVRAPTNASRAFTRDARRQEEGALRNFLLDGVQGPNGLELTPGLTEGAPGAGRMLPGLGGPVTAGDADPGGLGTTLEKGPLAPPAIGPRLNPDELAVVAQDPVSAWRVRDTPDLASAAAAESGLSGLHNGEGDAFRHAYWNALMTSRVGPEFAEALATAHETGSTNPANEVQMDLFNNAVGRQIALEHPGATDEELKGFVMEALRAGRLMTAPPSAAPSAAE